MKFAMNQRSGQARLEDVSYGRREMTRNRWEKLSTSVFACWIRLCFPTSLCSSLIFAAFHMLYEFLLNVLKYSIDCRLAYIERSAFCNFCQPFAIYSLLQYI